MEYPWPGNVRELEHALEHAFILCRGKVIAREHLPAAIRDYDLFGKLKSLEKAVGRKPASEQKILEALQKAGGNKAKAARLLGINRRTLYRKLRKDNIRYIG